MFQELTLFLDQHFPYCSGKFGPDAFPEVPRNTCRDLLGEDGFASLVEPYADRQAGVDRRAALSVWSMYYFSHLAISPAVLWLMFRCAIPLAPGNLDLRLCDETRLPEKIVVRKPEARLPASTIHDAFGALVFDHAAPLIAQFSRAGLSPRLLWSNFAVYIEWIVREIGRMDPQRGQEGLALLENKHWPDGRPNPLYGLLSLLRSDGPEAFTRRRVCCLRYLLPDMPGCGMVCPLPSGRT